ncbi:hypothetical protein [Microbacterium sp. NPDC089695]|uniref:hypothetical protein n=1 Tax=Microbacterium sp. NPDC089695 TaxID=3364198 RepID=UPI0038292040
MHIDATFLSNFLTESLVQIDQGERYIDRLLRDNGEVLLFCFYPNDSVRTSQFVEDTLSDPFCATGIHVMVVEDLPRQTGPRADHLRRVRVVSAGQVVFDRVITVGASHVELVRWYNGDAAFDLTLPSVS